MENLIRKLPTEKINAHINKDTAVIMPLIQQWQQEGIILSINPEVIAGVIRAIFVLSLHKKEVGEAVFGETIEFLIDSIVSGLVKQEG
jgi:hypothetical protein